MENLQKFVSLTDLIEYIFSVDPTHDVSKIRLAIGTEMTAKFLEKLEALRARIVEETKQALVDQAWRG